MCIRDRFEPEDDFPLAVADGGHDGVGFLWLKHELSQYEKQQILPDVYKRQVK